MSDLEQDLPMQLVIGVDLDSVQPPQRSDRRGRRQTCWCGECKKCRAREYMRWRKNPTVDSEFHERSVRRQYQRRRWTLEDDALLGTMTDAALAKLLDRSENSVNKRRRQFGIKAHRGHGDQRKKMARLRNGYIVVRLPPNDPFIEMVDNGGVVKEHRLVMAESLGRPLAMDEAVHHRNGVKTDNRLENLELWTRSHPDGQRVHEIFDWCLDFIARYGEEIDRT